MCLETFIAIGHCNFIFVKPSNENYGLMYFLSHFSSNSFLLYFIKVVVYDGLAFKKKEKLVLYHRSFEMCWAI